MPLTRRSRASSGGSVERPAEAASTSASTSMCTTWPRAWTPVSVRPAQTRSTVGTRSAVASAAVELALHRPQPGLGGPAVEVGAVVGEVDPESHGREAYCARA